LAGWDKEKRRKKLPMTAGAVAVRPCRPPLWGCPSRSRAPPLWPTITRDTAHHHHQATCKAKALEIEDYTLRDSRHSWAVRCRKRGGSLEEIASQLGHKNIYMAATVYGVFKPTIDERRTGLRIAR
jgi:integrase